jgi:threonine/homoserine/homoserine lactone efflux protein
MPFCWFALNPDPGGGRIRCKSTLIAQSAVAYAVVKYIGAAYLIYLGIRTLASSAPADGQSAPLPTAMHKAFRDGIIVEALNVKTAMFFLAFIPQFLSSDHALAPQFIVLGTTCIMLNSAADVVAVFAAHRVAASDTARVVRQRIMTRTLNCAGAESAGGDGQQMRSWLWCE